MANEMTEAEFFQEPEKIPGKHRFMAGTCVDCGKPLALTCIPFEEQVSRLTSLSSDKNPIAKFHEELRAYPVASLSSETKTCVCAPVEHVHAEHCPCSDAVPASSPAAQNALDLDEEMDNEPPICARCGNDFILVDWDTPRTKYCDNCAHIRVAELEAATPSTPPSPKSQDDIDDESLDMFVAYRKHVASEWGHVEGTPISAAFLAGVDAEVNKRIREEVLILKRTVNHLAGGAAQGLLAYAKMKKGTPND